MRTVPSPETPVIAFWVLLALFGLLFFTGGSSWQYEPGLMILRPTAILMTAWGLWHLDMEAARPYGALYILFGLATLIVFLHLLPLPPGIWTALPGREILAEIDKTSGHLGIWRPLSMSPQDTLNAIYSLSVPAAVLVLAPQLPLYDQFRLLLGVCALILLSGLVVAVQAAGTALELYPGSSLTPGIFANRNHEAALLVLAFPALAGSAYILIRQGRNQRIVSGLAITLGLALIPMLIVLGSRAGLLLAVLGIAALPALQLRFRRDRKSDKPRLARLAWLAAIGSALGVMVGLTVLTSRDLAMSRLPGLNDDMRFGIWHNVTADLPHYMPWGVGAGAFADVFQIHEPPTSLQSKFINHAHNDWLEIAYVAGIPGIALVLLGLAMAISGVWQVRRAPGPEFGLSRVGFMMIILLAFASLSDYPARTPLIMAIGTLAAIWALAYKRFGSQADGK